MAFRYLQEFEISMKEMTSPFVPELVRSQTSGARYGEFNEPAASFEIV